MPQRTLLGTLLLHKDTLSSTTRNISLHTRHSIRILEETTMPVLAPRLRKLTLCILSFHRAGLQPTCVATALPRRPIFIVGRMPYALHSVTIVTEIPPSPQTNTIQP